MRRNAVRSIGVEACLFDPNDLEQLYAVFKVRLGDVLKELLFSVDAICLSLRCPFEQRSKSGLIYVSAELL